MNFAARNMNLPPKSSKKTTNKKVKAFYRNIKNLSLSSIAACFLISCTSMPYPEGKPMPAQTFAHIKRIEVPVQTLSIRKENMSQKLPANLENMLDRYFKRKINTVGRAGFMEVGYKDVILKSEPLQNNPFNLEGFLGQGNNVLYTLNLQIGLSVKDHVNNLLASENVVIKHRYTISRHASIESREKIELLEMEKLFKALDPVVEKIVLKQAAYTP